MALPGDCALSFELIDTLGGGGFGTVYRCRHRQLKSLAAVKVMRRELAGSAEQVERFVREAKVAAALKHPHVVGVLDAGAETDPWIAFEYVEGRSLEDRLAKGRLEVEEVLDLGVQLCSALELAHANGVVHRDIKPANVLRDGAAWKLADFGIAHTDAGRTLTAAGMLLGTPAYIDPLYVQTGEASPQNDLYALGAVLYEAATGVRAIPGDEPGQIVKNAVRVVPPLASTHAPGVPPRLDALLARTLAKNQADRFPDATAFGQALEAVRARDGSAIEPGERRAKREAGPRSQPPTLVRELPRDRPRWRIAVGGALVAVALVASRGPRPDPRASVSAAVAPDAARPLLAGLSTARAELLACLEKFKTGQLIDGVGYKAVINASEVEPLLANVAVKLLDVAERARETGAPRRVWAWLTNQIHELTESLRYFPTPPGAGSRLGRALAKLAELKAPEPLYQPLVASSVRCALQSGKSAEEAAAKACDEAYGRVAASDEGWSDPGERAGFLVTLVWRQMHHERRAQKKGDDRPELCARVVEQGELLALRGSVEMNRFDALPPALVIAADVAREHPARDPLEQRARMKALTTALGRLRPEQLPPGSRELLRKMAP